MVETKWKAVAIGFGVIFLVNLVGTSFQQLALLGGTIAAIVGGWAAGYYARSGRVNGAWNGFLAGSIGALVSIAILVALGLAASIVQLSLGGVFATVTIGLAVLVLVVVSAIPATVGGYIGGTSPRAETEETLRPAA